MKFLSLGITTAILLLTAGCNSTTSNPSTTQTPKLVNTSTSEKKEPVLYTAKPCFTRMSDMAQRWSADALPFHVESSITTEANGQAGTSTVWRALFASPSRGTFKTFTCSGSRLPDQPPLGITSTVESGSSPLVASLEFHPSYLQMDSDKAFAVAQQHGGASLTKKDPQQPVLYILERDAKRKALFWYVVYGKSQSESKGIGVINATTGGFVRGGK
ncbi:MAG TPA: hypothetical protein VMT53_16215 [Terriglobales bacterium]|nr:hypothetical protein [Terriglobales bacterium]